MVRKDTQRISYCSVGCLALLFVDKIDGSAGAGRDVAETWILGSSVLGTLVWTFHDVESITLIFSIVFLFTLYNCKKCITNHGDIETLFITVRYFILVILVRLLKRIEDHQ